ncbi:MAG: winged helix-turn-helix domain-containing protein [Mariniphaga sp.]|nr:winged helix-turn-helix domain-containing protein [Mariniphaga sp.]MDD4226161.1 winged helix-turn-helix domain-containing protein [Mariniphaga sp.]
MIKSQIEKNALKIWQFLDNNQLSSVFEIEKGLSMQRQDVLLALGWLAGEDKIYFLDDQKDSKIMLIVDMDED